MRSEPQHRAGGGQVGVEVVVEAAFEVVADAAEQPVVGLVLAADEGEEVFFLAPLAVVVEAERLVLLRAVAGVAVVVGEAFVAVGCAG